MDPIRVLLMTAPADAAPALARTLVEERLAACVSLLPQITSVYRWEGVVEEAQETLLLIKTPAALVEQLLARALELHPYAVPELLALPVEGGFAGYLDWVHSATAGGNDATSADR